VLPRWLIFGHARTPLGLELSRNACPWQADLGGTYLGGQGVPQDYIQAHMWFNLAGAGGFTKSVELRDTVAGKMTLQQIADAQRLARDWKPKASR